MLFLDNLLELRRFGLYHLSSNFSAHVLAKMVESIAIL